MSDVEGTTPDSGLDIAMPASAGEDSVSGKEKEPNVVISNLLAFVDLLRKEGAFLIITAVILALVIKWLVVQPFFIPSESMQPTLEPGDRVLVSKFIYRFVEPKPGDVIVFVAPNQEERSFTEKLGALFQGYEQQSLLDRFKAVVLGDDVRDFIKRVIAVEGDVVEIKDGNVYVNGEPSKGDYETMPGDFSNWGPKKIETDQVFVMGDNRPNSHDSRWIGGIKKNKILGKAFSIYWPLTRLEYLK